MVRTALNASAPIMAASGLYGIESNTLGTALLIIMALAVIVNQLWTVFEKIRNSIRQPEADTSDITKACGRYRREIGRTLDQLKKEDERQDQLNKERFDRIEKAISDVREELREDVKGLHASNEDVLRAVSRLEGKVNQ